MEYSPITEFKIRNFRQLANVDLNFDRPIVTVVGENDAGKTSIILALAVCGLNAYATKQKKYIKRGKNAFGLSLSLEDGTEIRRIKSSTQNSLQIYRGEDVILDLSKIDNPSIQPLELEKVMGLLKDGSTGEILNIRTYNDRLIFAQTTSGDNYKIIYELLKVSNLVKAIKRGSEESSKLKKSINDNAILIEHTLNNLREIKQVNIEPLLIMRNGLIEKWKKSHKVRQAVDKKQIIDKYNNDTLGLVDRLHIINGGQYEKLIKAINSNKFINENNINTSLIEKVQAIDILSYNKLSKALMLISGNTDVTKIYNQISKLSTIDTPINKLAQAINNLYKLKDIKELDVNAELIDTVLIEKIEKVSNTYQYIKSLNDKIKDLTSSIDNMVETLKDSGIKYKICQNCGEVVLLDE